MERAKQVGSASNNAVTKSRVMQYLFDLSFQQKLILGTVLLMSAVLVLTFLVVLTNEHKTLRKSLADSLNAQARVMALTSAEFVKSGDKTRAQEILKSLSSIEQFRFAVMYMPDGSIFSSYSNLDTDHSPVQLINELGAQNEGQWIIGKSLIQDKDNVLGSVWIAAAPYTVSGLVQGDLPFMLGVFFLLSGMMVFYISVLLNFVSAPLTRLTEVISNVTRSADYSLRSGYKSGDEIGALAQGFDRMLDVLEERDRELELNKGELEEKVKERTAALNDEIEKHKRTVKELEEATLAAEIANKTKSEFLANMSHEIRTPLTAIIGFAESTMEKDQTVEERINAIDVIIRNGKHLLTIINEILDLAKIESGKIEIENLQVPLYTLVEDVRTLLNIQAADKGVSLSVNYQFPLPKSVITDPTRLKQILLNLGSNAIKFTERGGVSIEVGCDESRNQLCFKVSDTGIGMSSQQLNNLFTPFVQGDPSTTRRFGGTGLGLYISQKLSNLLGGNIIASSTPDRGSLFTLWVDAGDLSHQVLCTQMNGFEKQKESGAFKGVPKLEGRILLAEDNPDNQALVSLYVRKTGATIDIVENGQQAYDKAMGGNYHVVLMDMQMPVMDGIESTIKLRAAGCRTPIVSLTANASGHDIDSCFGAGATGFLSKPIEWDKFFSTLAVYLPEAPEERPTEPIKPQINGGEAALKTACTSFISTLPKKVEMIQYYLDNRAWLELQAELNDIKLSGGAFGFPVLSELAGKLEFVIKKKTFKELPDGVQELIDIINRIECTDMSA